MSPILCVMSGQMSGVGGLVEVVGGGWEAALARSGRGAGEGRRDHLIVGGGGGGAEDTAPHGVGWGDTTQVERASGRHYTHWGGGTTLRGWGEG